MCATNQVQVHVWDCFCASTINRVMQVQWSGGGCGGGKDPRGLLSCFTLGPNNNCLCTVSVGPAKKVESGDLLTFVISSVALFSELAWW